MRSAKTVFGAMQTALLVLGSVAFLPAAVDATQAPFLEGSTCAGSNVPICDALRLAEPELRLEQGRRAIRGALLSQDPAISGAAGLLLSGLSGEVDLRPYADLFAEACSAHSRCFWTPERADFAELHFGPRATRLDILERAIRSGGFKQTNGTLVMRVLAVQWAAWQGLDELAPLVDEFLATLTDRDREELRLTETSLLLTLTTGAETQGDAPSVAVSRLAAMDDEDFARRMDEDSLFRGTVTGVGSMACQPRLLPGRAFPGCLWLAGIVERQKRRFPDRSFQEGDIGLPDDERLPHWLEALHGDARGWAPASPEEFVPLEAGAHGPPRPAGIDPCTLPELWGSEHWTPVTYAGSGVVLRDLTSPSGQVVSVADGIRGHKAGETVRLKVDVIGPSGARLADPFAMRIALTPHSGGSLSPPGKGRSCQSINLFWNRAASEGTSLLSFDEFDYTLGSAAPAGRIPDPEVPRRSLPIWRATERIEVQLVKIRDIRSPSPQGGSVFDVRPEGDPRTTMPTPFDALRRRRPLPPEAEFFGPDLEEGGIVIHGPTRQYAALVDKSRTGDTRTVLCFSQRQNGKRVTQDEPVVLRRLEDTPIFVGSFLAMPDGSPEAGTEPGGVLSPPAVVIPLGLGDVGCEDPRPSDGGARP